MRRPLLIALVAGLALGGCSKDKGDTKTEAPEATTPPPVAAKAPAASPDARRVPIEVRKTGYVPNTLAADSKEEIVLVFTRVEETECGRYIKIKGSDDQVELPMNQAVELPVTMPDSGELVFTCGMDMMHGIVTVNPTPS